ncbi:unnamed protein product [Thelazia callipaeda]|uniref:Uncharacterized protein n=1 Tax=Thelazia callipaeda TaxID=103827 RepID=A0A0N5D5D3_THECL|nr:unnamed protein product [Thelazia callipaeda]
MKSAQISYATIIEIERETNENNTNIVNRMVRIGWFDAFRENGDPTWFGENRTPVVFDLQIFALLSVFVTPLLAFFIILPGVRHYRIASTITIVLTITVGAIILSKLFYFVFSIYILIIFKFLSSKFNDYTVKR